MLLAFLWYFFSEVGWQGQKHGRHKDMNANDDVWPHWHKQASPVNKIDMRSYGPDPPDWWSVVVRVVSGFTWHWMALGGFLAHWSATLVMTETTPIGCSCAQHEDLENKKKAPSQPLTVVSRISPSWCSFSLSLLIFNFWSDIFSIGEAKLYKS